MKQGVALACLIVVPVLAACKSRTSPPSPDPAARVLSSAEPLASASASAAPLPDHWSTTIRDQDTLRATERRPGATVFAALSVSSDDGEEGELYLERAGTSVYGLWEETAVDGTFGEDNALTLKDVGTGETLFQGRIVENRLSGELRAEGETRRVRSLKPRALDRISQRIELSETWRALTIHLEEGAVKQVTLKVRGKPKGKPDPKAEAKLEGNRLTVTDERGTFVLEATARALVGRSPAGRIFMTRLDDVASDPPLPVEQDGVRVSSAHLRKGARGTPCEIDLELPQVKGTYADEELTKKLHTLAINIATGPWPESGPAPTLDAFTCKRDELSDLRIQSATFSGIGLPGGFINLEVSGYARFSSMGGVTVLNECVLVDGKRGELVESVVDRLPGPAQEVLLQHANRRLKRQYRTARLSLDESFVSEDLPGLRGTSLCFGKGDPSLLIPQGLITRSMPTGPMRVSIPRHVIQHALPADHLFRPLLEP